MATIDPILLPDASSNKFSESKRWGQILTLEKLSPTTDDRKTEVQTKDQPSFQLGNVSLKSTDSDLPDFTFSSYGNYDYFEKLYPPYVPDSNEKWNAAWLGDDRGCKCNQNEWQDG
jgi:hypothetical protein